MGGNSLKLETWQALHNLKSDEATQLEELWA